MWLTVVGPFGWMPIGLDGACGVVGLGAVVDPFGWMPVDAVEW